MNIHQMNHHTFKKFNNKRNKGFTLIELLVVIAIIALLSSIVLASVTTARAKARDAQRKTDLRQLQIALELYFQQNGSYPPTVPNTAQDGTSNPGWYGLSTKTPTAYQNTSGPNGYIPGLAPKYISVLPTDPRGITTLWSGYLYRSDFPHDHYKLLSHFTGPESFPGFPTAGTFYYDPYRPTTAWKVCDQNKIYTTSIGAPISGDHCSL